MPRSCVITSRVSSRASNTAAGPARHGLAQGERQRLRVRGRPRVRQHRRSHALLGTEAERREMARHRAAVARTNRLLSEAQASPNYQALLEQAKPYQSPPPEPGIACVGS